MVSAVAPISLKKSSDRCAFKYPPHELVSSLLIHQALPDYFNQLTQDLPLSGR